MALPGHRDGCFFDGEPGTPPCICGSPPPQVDLEVSALIRLAEYCRKNGFRIGAVKLGSLSLQIEDLRLETSEDLKGRPQVGIWEAAGLEGGIPGDGTVGS